MKRNIFVAALLLFIIGCNSHQSDQFTQQQKDEIKKDVQVAVDSIVARCERLDAEGMMQYYWDSPDFIAVNPDGSRSDYQAMKKAHVDLFSSAASLQILVTRQDFMVLTKDIVIDALILKSEVILKSGEKMVFDPNGLTLVFHKLAGQWKVILSHESAAMAMQKAGKK